MSEDLCNVLKCLLGGFSGSIASGGEFCSSIVQSVFFVALHGEKRVYTSIHMFHFFAPAWTGGSLRSVIRGLGGSSEAPTSSSRPFNPPSHRELIIRIVNKPLATFYDID